MATKLEKDLIRESSVQINEREVLVTLGKDQTIGMKLKGMKSGGVSIGLEELYCQLTDCDFEKPEKPKGSLSISNERPAKGIKGNPMINLDDLRSINAISTLDYDTIAKFDQIIKNAIEHIKK